MLEKVEQINLLKDFYGPLLTERQQEVLSLYYEQDWSLSEIALHQQVTRQAVHDLLKRSEHALQDYENRLHLVERFQTTRRQIEEVYSLLNTAQPNQETMKQAVQILREVSDLL